MLILMNGASSRLDYQLACLNGNEKVTKLLILVHVCSN
jgi:hypothetical protein